MNIVIEYDNSASTNAAPIGFKQAVQAAVNYIDALITDPITVPIVFSYGELQNQAFQPNTLGESQGNGYFVTYAQMVHALAATASSADDIMSVLNLPSDPTGGTKIFLSDAQAKALGFGSDPHFIDPEDGFVALTNSHTLTYDPNNRAVSGAYDAIGILEHEITEVLGRTGGLGRETFNGTAFYTPLDMFRYSAPGAHSFSYTGASFSVDGNNLLYTFNDPNNGGDIGDWASGLAGDSFGSGYLGLASLVSSTDTRVMDLLGYKLSTTTSAPSLNLTGAQFSAGAAILGQIGNPYTLNLTGVAVANLAAAEQNGHVMSISITDHSFAVFPVLAALGGDSRVVGITLTDSIPFDLSLSQYLVDSAAFAKISGGYSLAVGGVPVASRLQLEQDSHVTSVLINDSAANVSAAIDALNGDALVSRITLTDAAPLAISALQSQADTVALGKIGGPFNMLVTGGPGADILLGAGGADTLDGGAGADTLTGGSGADTFVLRPGAHADLITDFSHAQGDKIDLSALTGVHSFGQLLASSSQSGADTILDLGGGDTLRLQNVTHTALTLTDFVLPPASSAVPTDFNGDGKADILWRNANNGDVYLFTSSANAVAAPGQDLGLMAANFHVDQVADFTGDGKADILWRNTADGDSFLWTSSANAVAAPGQDLGIVGLQWQVQAAADFNGDGKADILWRNMGNGDAYLFTSSANAVAAPGQDLGIVGLQWQVQAAADFNGDGKADILWRNLGNGDVYLFTSSANGVAAPGQDLGLMGLQWHVQAVADFNGDGKADILWRNANDGDVTLWTSSANAVAAPGQDLGIVGLQWQVQTAADFNGDGLADILWRNGGNGDAYLWTSSANAIAAPGIDLGVVALNWQVAAPTFF